MEKPSVTLEVAVAVAILAMSAAHAGDRQGDAIIKFALPATADRSTDLNPLGAISLEDLRLTRDRPLFSLTRRPPAASLAVSSTEEKPTANSAPSFDLVGTVIFEGPSFVFVNNRSTNKVTRLYVGDIIGGWRVRDIRARLVTLESETQTQDIALGGAPPVLTPVPTSTIYDRVAEPVVPQETTPIDPGDAARQLR